MRTDRLVIDTNVFISGFIAPTSVPGRLVDRAIGSAHLLATNEAIDELVARLMAPRFDTYLPRHERRAVLDRLVPLIEIVSVVRIITACRDANDDKFLESAVNGAADALITGDRDLLVLHPFMGIAILTPAGYLARIDKA